VYRNNGSATQRQHRQQHHNTEIATATTLGASKTTGAGSQTKDIMEATHSSQMEEMMTPG
jgi:hypothetical protein